MSSTEIEEEFHKRFIDEILEEARESNSPNP